jgi:hypothetical protein
MVLEAITHKGEALMDLLDNVLAKSIEAYLMASDEWADSYELAMGLAKSSEERLAIEAFYAPDHVCSISFTHF